MRDPFEGNPGHDFEHVSRVERVAILADLEEEKEHACGAGERGEVIGYWLLVVGY